MWGRGVVKIKFMNVNPLKGTSVEYQLKSLLAASNNNPIIPTHIEAHIIITFNVPTLPILPLLPTIIMLMLSLY